MTKPYWMLAGVLLLSGCGGCGETTAPPAATAVPAAAAAAPIVAKTAAPPQGTPQDEEDCIVIADANPDYGPPPLSVAFTAEAECTSGAVKYKWDFGDGTSSTEANPTHSYTKVGDYEATVTVNAGKAEATDEIDITVEEGDEEDGQAD